MRLDMSRQAALSNWGAIKASAQEAMRQAKKVSHVHDRSLEPSYVKGWDPDSAADMVWLQKFAAPTGPFSAKTHADISGDSPTHIDLPAASPAQTMPESVQRQFRVLAEDGAKQRKAYRQGLIDQATACVVRLQSGEHDVESCLSELEGMVISPHLLVDVLGESGAGRAVNAYRKSALWGGRARALVARWKEECSQGAE